MTSTGQDEDSVSKASVTDKQDRNESLYDEIRPGEKTPDSNQLEKNEKSAQQEHNNDSTANDSYPNLSKARSIALVIVVAGAAFLNTMSVQICVIVLPTIGRALQIPGPRQQWVISAYSLTFGCFLLAWGRIADVYGKKKIFILGSAWLAVCTLIAPFVPSEVGFDVLRALQGLGAAANVPTALGILGVTFPPGKLKNYAYSMYAAGAPIGAIIGLLVGGIVAQYASWHWAFWILCIMAATITVAGYFVIPAEDKNPESLNLARSVDWVGACIVTAGLIILLFALTEGNIAGWSTPWIPVLIVLGVLFTTAFVLWQLWLEKRTTRRPLMKMTIFQNVQVAAAAGIMALYFASFNAYLIFTTFYFQDYKGLDPIQTTIRLLPFGVVGLLTVAVVAQLLARVRVNYLLVFGTFCGAISSLLFAVPIPPSTTYWAYAFPSMCLSVFGADTVTPALLLFVAQSLPKEDQALGGGMINAVREVGRAIGLAIATAIQVAVERSKGTSGAEFGGATHSAALLAGLRGAQWFNLALCLTGCCIAAVAFRHAGKVGAKK